MSLDFSEFNQVLAERYESLLREENKVAMYYDYRPHTRFWLTMQEVIKGTQDALNMTYNEVKKAIINSAESFWVPEHEVIIIRCYVDGNKIFVELPKMAFLWPHEYDAMLEKEKIEHMTLQ
jgi:hypothetical protein